MKSSTREIEKYRLTEGLLKSDKSFGMNGAFIFNNGIQAIASDQGGWEHISVSLKNRCPTWDEMNHIKNLFWDESETVIQYHPAKARYINNHPFCLHLWKPIGIKIPIPPEFMVGIKS